MDNIKNEKLEVNNEVNPTVPTSAIINNLDNFNDSFAILHPEVVKRKNSVSVLLDTSAAEFSFEKEKPLTGEDIRLVIEKTEPKAKVPKFKNVVMNSLDNFNDSTAVPTEEYKSLMNKVTKPKMR